MISWIKSWFAPPILQYGIEQCPVCNRNIQRSLSIFQKRRCEMVPNYDGVFTFHCGRCEGRSEWCGTPGDKKPLVFLRVTWPRKRMEYIDLLNLAQDTQARYNIRLIHINRTNLQPDRTILYQCSKKELLKYIKRIEYKIKNIKIC